MASLPEMVCKPAAQLWGGGATVPRGFPGKVGDGCSPSPSVLAGGGN